MASVCPLPPIDRFAPDPLAALPSWRVQQHYQNRVMVGNWAEEREKGVPLSVLFPHHNAPHSWYYVTQYDEHINRRPNPCLPPLRKWNKRTLTWSPESSDYPLIAPPTNFGLLGEKRAALKRQMQNQPKMYDTIYTLSYGPNSLVPREPIKSQW
ncbi:uncharacterized protein C1orf158 homolog isoform X2 [Scyliorhinus canicula]|uniref:uncharacterized protein C1orf158 homolog isoform X2 n=1 Tax=Scyliorhinus canicula TaxID=7830 RepID=UPI0018F774A1|nr:uncharacterized protein C1orf158 homolog isoform X2 [Scyliorhinus canicula]